MSYYGDMTVIVKDETIVFKCRYDANMTKLHNYIQGSRFNKRLTSKNCRKSISRIPCSKFKIIFTIYFGKEYL